MILTALNNLEEEVVLQNFKALARELCRPEIEALVECSSKRTFSMIYACKVEKAAVNKCLAPHTTDEKLDEMRIAEMQKKEQHLKRKGVYPQ